MASSSTLIESLSNHDANEVMKFMKVFKGKHEHIIDLVSAEFQDSQELLTENHYTCEEVEEKVDSLKSIVKACLRDELQTVRNMMTILLKQVLENATDQGARVDLALDSMDDQSLLDKAAAVRLDRPIAKAEAKPTPEKLRGSLSAIKEVHSNDSLLVKENMELKKARDQLALRLKDMQLQTTSVLKERSRLAEEVLRLTQSLQEVESELSAVACVAEAKGGDSKEDDDDVDEKGRPDEVESSSQASQSKQMQQMRKMLQQKNEELTKLRRKMRHYEPDDLEAD
eukprot:CAMPEP_0185779828 /NCGR_PEP_ID=MMETSP1174-20130828/97061_1 /TAXON_ID=35687 /ORGANISM="Dictyocha speculum, Strain CCMP1381" /LENGTH=283 /DNA_ID=CAMNT_0028469097 /DNA_START=93 /DNA_END=941 /DNA_ORIENTATION=-